MNHRFITIDNVMTWEEAKACGQFRVKDIIDPKTNKLVLILEHEVRCVTRNDYSLKNKSKYMPKL